MNRCTIYESDFPLNEEKVNAKQATFLYELMTEE